MSTREDGRNIQSRSCVPHAWRAWPLCKGAREWGRPMAQTWQRFRQAGQRSSVHSVLKGDSWSNGEDWPIPNLPAMLSPCLKAARWVKSEMHPNAWQLAPPRELRPTVVSFRGAPCCLHPKDVPVLHFSFRSLFHHRDCKRPSYVSRFPFLNIVWQRGTPIFLFMYTPKWLGLTLCNTHVLFFGHSNG